MTALSVTVLAASVLGSLHCAGMCGGLVAFYSASGGGASGRTLAHVAYNGGRLVAYLALGAGAGALGRALDLAGAAAGLQRVAGLVAGGLVVLWGSVTLLRTMNVSLPGRAPSWRWPRRLRAGLGRVAGLPPGARALVVGLLTGALPCGWLWAFVLTAGGTASAGRGALLMALFWLGTLPVLLALGLGLQALWRPLWRRLPAACAVAMIVLGLLGVAGRMRGLDAPAVPPAPVPAGDERMHPGAMPGHGHAHR